MGLIIVLVFVGVFAAVAIPWIASSVGPSQKAKEVQTRLASALATEAPEPRDLIVNLRKEDQLSSIPWLNKKLLKFELTPYLRKVLDQANLELERGQAACHVRGQLCDPVLSRRPALRPNLAGAGGGTDCRHGALWLGAVQTQSSASTSSNRDCRKRSI